MRPLSAAQLLDAWEQGLSGPPSRRVLPLLAVALPDASIEAVATLSIGERDRWLLALRSSTFGPQLSSVTSCCACGKQLEWTINSADLWSTKQADLPNQFFLELDQYRIGFRLPNTLDLAAIAGCANSDIARRTLLQRCISSVEREGHQLSTDDVSDAVGNAVAKRMGEADPLVDIQVDLTCPACGQHWQALLDIESFFWSEVNAWAHRLLSEVHMLARAYGWCEKDILNLSPWRRQFYLGLVGG